MAKISLRDIIAGFGSAAQHTANNANIEDALNNKVLYRNNPVGEDNAMENDLDMNSNRILNLPSATQANEPLTYGQWTGQTTTAQITGTAREEQTATAGQTSFTLTTTSFTVGVANLSVYINGVLQHPGAYTETNTTQVDFSEGLDAGDAVLFVVNERTVSADTVAASSVTHTQEGTGGAQRALNSILNDLPYYNVKGFGAVGDGVTDDTTAIQAAINAALTAEGGTVWFPETGSDYLFTTLTIEAPVDNRSRISLEMEGETASDNSSQLQCTSTTATAIHIYDGRIRLKNIRLNASAARTASATQAIGIHLDGGQVSGSPLVNPILDNVRVSGQPGIGIVVEGVERGLFQMCDSNSNKREGWNILADGSSVGISNTFINCRAFSNAKGGWKIESWFNTFIDCQSLQNNDDTVSPETNGYEIELINSAQNNVLINFDVEAQTVFSGTPGTDRPTNMYGIRVSVKNNQIIGGIISGFNTGILIGSTGHNCLVQYPFISNSSGTMDYAVDNNANDTAEIHLRALETGVTTLVRNSKFSGLVDGRMYSGIQLLTGADEENITGAGALDPDVETTHIITTGANALTLADGDEGAHKYIVMQTDAGAGTLTPTNLANGTTVTFDDVGDSAHLYFTNGAWHFMGGTATLA